MKTYYCPECDAYVETYVREVEETYSVKNELDVAVCMPTRHCKVCGGDIWDSELDSKILNEIYRIYEQKTGRKIK